MRSGGYAPIEEYALIGDGRTAALVALDGAIDWLCLPNFDSPSVFGAILDTQRGGHFAVHPAMPFSATRRYLPGTNVLETTFTTDRGVVRLVDAMTLPDDRLPPLRELVRSLHGMSGVVPMRWRCAPRFEYGARAPRCGWRAGVPVATSDADAVGVVSWDAGAPAFRDGAIEATFDLGEGGRALLALTSASAEPLVLPSRSAVSARLDATIRFWEGWAAARPYEGVWRDSVLRSALVLKLMIFAPSGASVAAPTTSLPEEIGGQRNWDYRFCWIRDSNFMIDALLRLGCYDEARMLFWWFMQATALTEPVVDVLYRLDGGVGIGERELPLDGYRGSRPIRVGNGAVEQRQHDIYGGLFETAWLYSSGHHALDADTGAVLGRIADHVCDIWRRPDSGIWEVRNGPFHFTHSKVMCWVALDRAIRLAAAGEMPRRHAARWQREADAIRDYVETQCWSDTLRSYTRTAGSGDVDASLLMLPIVEFGDPKGDRIASTIAAVDRQLRDGDVVYRYHAADGVPGGEGCFLNCSFWLVSALARCGRVDDASALMDRLVARANDVGLYSEEIDPRSAAFLGNFPQALVHLSLIDAAVALSSGSARRRERQAS
ncbi:MAG TPA: glycoside hydrolase family 15 protein [Vicinamibacterales bacterium]|nr:glycoside hydrolase family 15 protein [Vicinamibacterales bacterium]